MNIPVLNLPALSKGHHYRFHAMVKPTGARCNIDCSYCFYLHKTELLHHAHHSRMNDETLEQHIHQYIEAQTGEEVIFSWQGGEPTLMGLEFFERIVTLQKKHAKPGQRISNDLQTNGITLDKHWVAFLKKNNFHVGISIDGPRELHDIYRKTRSGKSTFDQVMNAISLLKEEEIPYAALCAVNRINALHPREVYRFLVDEVGTSRVQFTPVVEPKQFEKIAPALLYSFSTQIEDTYKIHIGQSPSIVTEWTVDADDYGDFLIEIWDEWVSKDIGNVHVNLFETMIAQAAGLPAQTCTQSEFCGKALAVEHDGEVYSCDHFVYPEYNLGNLHNTHLGDMAFSEKQKKFGFAKRDSLPGKCRRCDYLRLCWGECPKNRIIKTHEGEVGLNYLCNGLYRFYKHADPTVVHILKQLGYLG